MFCNYKIILVKFISYEKNMLINFEILYLNIKKIINANLINVSRVYYESNLLPSCINMWNIL